MYGIGDELWIRIERLMEVDELRLSDASYGLDSLLNFLLPLLRAAFKAWVVVSDGREECDDDAALRVLLAQRVDESEVVAHELVAIVGPVAWIGVVYAEVYHSDVALESFRFSPFLLSYVGSMSVAEQCGARLPEVAHFVAVAQHLLQLRRIRLCSRVGERHAVCNAVAYARHACLLEVDTFRHARVDCKRKRKQQCEC